MREGRLWRFGAAIHVPDIGISSRGKKSLRAFEVGRLEKMASEIINIVLKSKQKKLRKLQENKILILVHLEGYQNLK
jgi:hypothetical protein